MAEGMSGKTSVSKVTSSYLYLESVEADI